MIFQSISNQGDSYITSDTGNLWVYDGKIWNSIGNIQGPTGNEGKKGNTGERGPTGPTGIEGKKGNTGERGPVGFDALATYAKFFNDTAFRTYLKDKIDI